MSKLTINNEKELFEAIHNFERNKLEGYTDLEFVNWPDLDIKIKGKHFDGGMPARVMPLFVSYQAILDATFKQIATKKSSSKVLIEKPEIIIKIEPGSSKFVAKLFVSVNQKLIGDLTADILHKVLHAVGLIVPNFPWKYLIKRKYDLATEKAKNDHEYRMRSLEIEEKKMKMKYDWKMSQEETKRVELQINALNNNKTLAMNYKQSIDAKEQLIKKLDDNDVLYIEGEPLIDGDLAKLLFKKPRGKRTNISEEINLNGRYLIESLDSGKIENGFRASVFDVETNETIGINFDRKNLSTPEIELLQQSEWDKSFVDLEINARLVGGKIQRARLVSVKKPTLTN